MVFAAAVVFVAAVLLAAAVVFAAAVLPAETTPHASKPEKTTTENDYEWA